MTPTASSSKSKETTDAVSGFVSDLERCAPPAARIQRIEAEDVPPIGDTSFGIVASHHAASGTALVSPDLRTCDECLAELHDPDDRRHNYAFINCTNCGPRFTIIKQTPYDRPDTTMRPFRMCARVPGRVRRSRRSSVPRPAECLRGVRSEGEIHARLNAIQFAMRGSGSRRVTSLPSRVSAASTWRVTRRRSRR